MKKQLAFIPIIVFLGFGPLFTYGQYFGRNKPRYKKFDFKETQTPHFKILNYLEDKNSLNQFSSEAERWYNFHVQIFEDSIKYKNPIVLYNTHAEFQQTNVISGEIGVGTGGVTEGLKNRIVMPLMESNAQRDHVLGHELVHAFQYNIIKSDTSLSFKNLQNTPLWMVEGLAEYLSIGNNDPHTAMWMRDAVLNNDVPTIKDLNTNFKYFPYRYGQAFWAFVAGEYTDTIIKPFFEETLRHGLAHASDSLLNLSVDSLSARWGNFMKGYYSRFKEGKSEPKGKLLLGKGDENDLFVSPALSPDGKYIAFLARKNVFLLELFIAEVNTGEVIKKIGSLTRNSHVDAISSMESSGTWSPDGSKFAFVVFEKGRNNLAIIDVEKKRILEKIKPTKVNYISNPSWSPDGQSIVFTGLKEGNSDLYLLNFEDKTVKPLTNDVYSDLQPSWSPDGKKIVFSSDRLSYDRAKEGKHTNNLSVYDLNTQKIKNWDFFYGAENLNPQFSKDGSSIYFLSNRDGFRNIYEFNLKSYRLFRLSNFFTGVSGITPFSPAITTNRVNDEIAFTYFNKGGYTIYLDNVKDLDKKEIAPNDVDFKASRLAVVKNQFLDIVNQNLEEMNKELEHFRVDSLKSAPYKPRLGLTYIGNTSVGISSGSFGNGLMGGANMLFGDMLQNHDLFAGIALNGEVYDFAGQVAYFNKKSRTQWGIGLSHIPYRSGRLFYDQVKVEIGEDTVMADDYILELTRVFEDQLSLFSFLPISSKLRLEYGGSFSRYSFRRDLVHNYYVNQIKIGEDREKIAAPKGYNLYNANLAFVGDNSYMGIASPMMGSRYRFQLEGTLGRLNYLSSTADVRKYFYLKPFTLAWRGYHYSRHGNDAENEILMPAFLGFPGLVHGYDNVYYSQPRKGLLNDELTVNDLIGSKIIVSNLELRMPITGPKVISLVKSGIFLTELAWFFDGGVAWNNGEKLALTKESGKRYPVFSTGAALRINFFGQLIIEPYYALPLNRTDLKNGWTFGVNFIPGW